MGSQAVHEIERLVDETVERWLLPGVTCVVTDPDGPPQFVCRGLADIERSAPVDEHTVFRVASISKTFTAVALMQLWERGRFDLDEPANRHLTSYKLGRDDVTFRHLLTHTAGIGEVTSVRDVRRPGALGMIKADRQLPTLRDMYGPVQHVAIRPGTKWAYANHGFATLGQLVEDISGRPFADHMREAVFEPLGMEHTDFVRTPRVRERLAVGYRMTRKAAVPVKFRESTTTGAGGLFSCAADMSRYLATLAAGGTPLLKAETLELMLTPQYPRDSGLPAIGLAFWLEEIGGRLVAGHGGDLPGFKSSMRVAPHGPGAFLSINGGGTASLRMAAAIDCLGERIMTQLLQAPVDRQPPAPVRAPDLVGFYRPDRGFLTNTRPWALFGGEIEIIERAGSLHIRSPWGVARRPLPLGSAGAGLAFEWQGIEAQLDVERDESGRPAALHLRSSLGYGTFRRRSSSIRRVATLAALAPSAARAVRRRRANKRATES